MDVNLNPHPSPEREGCGTRLLAVSEQRLIAACDRTLAAGAVMVSIRQDFDSPQFAFQGSFDPFGSMLASGHADHVRRTDIELSRHAAIETPD